LTVRARSDDEIEAFRVANARLTALPASTPASGGQMRWRCNGTPVTAGMSLQAAEAERNATLMVHTMLQAVIFMRAESPDV